MNQRTHDEQTAAALRVNEGQEERARPTGFLMPHRSRRVTAGCSLNAASIRTLGPGPRRVNQSVFLGFARRRGHPQVPRSAAGRDVSPAPHCVFDRLMHLKCNEEPPVALLQLPIRFLTRQRPGVVSR